MTPQELIDYKKEQLLKKEEFVEPIPASSPDEIQKHMFKILMGVKLKIDNMSKYSGSYDCNYSYYMGEKYHLCNTLVENLKSLGFKTKVGSSSGGSNHDNDGIPSESWVSYRVEVDLTPIKEAIYA